MRPSPEVRRWENLVDIPVDHHTGIARIEVPIHTIEDGEYSSPNYLKYHQGGISTSELAPNTGSKVGHWRSEATRRGTVRGNQMSKAVMPVVFRLSIRTEL